MHWKMSEHVLYVEALSAGVGDAFTGVIIHDSKGDLAQGFGNTNDMSSGDGLNKEAEIRYHHRDFVWSSYGRSKCSGSSYGCG